MCSRKFLTNIHDQSQNKFVAYRILLKKIFFPDVKFSKIVNLLVVYNSLRILKVWPTFSLFVTRLILNLKYHTKKIIKIVLVST